jgi:hypothetical protein
MCCIVFRVQTIFCGRLPAKRFELSTQHIVFLESLVSTCYLYMGKQRRLSQDYKKRSSRLHLIIPFSPEIGRLSLIDRLSGGIFLLKAQSPFIRKEGSYSGLGSNSSKSRIQYQMLDHEYSLCFQSNINFFCIEVYHVLFLSCNTDPTISFFIPEMQRRKVWKLQIHELGSRSKSTTRLTAKRGKLQFV